MPDISSEAIFVIIFLLISLLSWIKDRVLKGKSPGRIEAQQQRPEPRYDAEPPDFPSAPTQRSSSSQPNDAMRDILKSLGIPVEEKAVSAPPPLPAAETSAPPSPYAAEEPAKETALVSPGPVDPESLLSRKEQAALRRKRGAYAISEHHSEHPIRAARNFLKPQNIQAAFLIKEILDKPKCFDY